MKVKIYKNILSGILLMTSLFSQSIEIPELFTVQDGTVNIPIYANNIINLESIQFEIEYDVSIIELEEINLNPNGALHEGYILTTNNNNGGIISFDVSLNSGESLSGNLLITEISFQTIGNLGDISDLTFINYNLNGENTNISNGSIEVILDNLIISAVDASESGADDFITLGMCESCVNGWRYGEDEYDTPNPPNAYTNIYFFHLDWPGQLDINNNQCEEYKFSSDYRQQQSNNQLISWGIVGNTGGGLSSSLPINLSWDSSKLNSNTENFKMFLYVGNNGGIDMQQEDNITILQSDLSTNDNFEPNITILLGACADIGTTTYYYDLDGDGWGSLQTGEYCQGNEPTGWVNNNLDLDDENYCESNLIDGCNVCDGNNEDLDCNGICFGGAQIDECGVCDGLGILDGKCDCAGNIEDCAGECGGSSVIAILCEDTDCDGLGNPGSETEVCIDGNRENITGCDIPDLHLFLKSDGTVLYNSSQPIAGFQFNVDGTTVNNGYGGDASNSNFMLSSNSATVIGFSFSGGTIPTGCGILLHLSLNGHASGLSDIVVSDSNGSPISFSYYAEGGIEYVDDCSDEYPDCAANEFDCNGECGGTAIIDECGVCDGDGPIIGYNCNGIPTLFEYNTSTQQALYFFTTVTIDDINIESNDWVGAFKGNTCVGAIKWDTSGCNNEVCSISIMGDDNSGFTDRYMTSGDIPSFKIFDASERSYFNATASDDIPWYNGDMNNIINNLHAVSSIDYCLPLNSFANLISFYGIPENDSLSQVMASIDDIVTGVITEGAAASQISPGNWAGSLFNISPQDGYWIIVSNNGELCLNDAIEIDSGFIYDLHIGANLISFPSSGQDSISNLIPDDVEPFINGIITEGAATSQISPGLWAGTLTTLEGGRGYWMIASENISFSFQLSSLMTHRIKKLNNLNYPNGFSINQSSNQGFYFIENIIIQNKKINDGWLLAYHDDILIGARKWDGNFVDIPLMGDDGNLYSKGYIKNGSIPTFVHYNESTKDFTTLYTNNIPEWKNNVLYMIETLESKNENKNMIPTEFEISAYPNPFNPLTNINISMPMEGIMDLSIYNLHGQKIEQLVYDYKIAGNYKYQWNANAYPSGVYFIHININQTHYNSQKLILIK